MGCTPGPNLRQAQVRMLKASADGELSDLISAVLLLHDQLRNAEGHDATTASTVPVVSDSLREAGLVIDSFLRRALVAV